MAFQHQTEFCSANQDPLRQRYGAMPQLAGFLEGLRLSALPGSPVQEYQLLVLGTDEHRRPALFDCETE